MQDLWILEEGSYQSYQPVLISMSFYREKMMEYPPEKGLLHF